jgi:hypothetical protein
MPDEVAVGTYWELSMEIFDDTGTYALDEPSQWYIYGFETDGTRTLLTDQSGQFFQVGSSDLWSTVPNPLFAAGIYEVVVVGLQGGTPFSAARAITARPKFAPFGLANDDVLVERTDGNETIFTQP